MLENWNFFWTQKWLVEEVWMSMSKILPIIKRYKTHQPAHSVNFYFGN